jgi:hypothetical protein
LLSKFHRITNAFFTCHEGSVEKFFKKIIADFHVLGLLIAKKHDLSEKTNFRLSHVVAVVHKIWVTPTAFHLRDKKLRLPESFGPT